jgi:hypothetical protein
MHDAEVRLERGERVVRDLRLRRRDPRDQRALARVGKTDQRNVSHELELEVQPALFAVFALLSERRGPAVVVEEAGVATPATSAVRGQPAVAVRDQVGQQRAIAIAHDGALGHLHDQVGAARAVAS